MQDRNAILYGCYTEIGFNGVFSIGKIYKKGPIKKADNDNKKPRLLKN